MLIHFVEDNRYCPKWRR